MRDPVNVAKQKQWSYLSLSHSHSPQVNVPLPEQCGLDSSYKKYITWQWRCRINRYFVMRSIIIAVFLFSTPLYKSTDTRLRTPGWQKTQGEGRVTRNGLASHPGEMYNYQVHSKHVNDIEDITRWREDMNFMFEWQEQCLTSERSERVKYCSCHENIKLTKIHIFELTCNVLFII